MFWHSIHVMVRQRQRILLHAFNARDALLTLAFGLLANFLCSKASASFPLRYYFSNSPSPTATPMSAALRTIIISILLLIIIITIY